MYFFGLPNGSLLFIGQPRINAVNFFFPLFPFFSGRILGFTWLVDHKKNVQNRGFDNAEREKVFESQVPANSSFQLVFESKAAFSKFGDRRVYLITVRKLLG